jgi:hypothetical protein
VKSIVSLALVLFTLLGCIELNAQAVRGGSKADEKKQDTCAGAGAPKLSLADVVLVLETPNLKRCIVDYVKKRDVSFYADPMITDTLKVLGAPDELYAMIPPPPKLPPPPPPPPPAAGPLTVLCELPASCDIGVTDHYSVTEDGKKVLKEEYYFGVAQDGKKVVNGLPAGAADLQVFADGFEIQKHQIQLQENQPKEEHFRLKPNAATSQQAARKTLQEVVAAFGGVEGLAGMAQASGNGTAALPDKNGQLSKWDMSFGGRWGSMVMNFRSALGECGATFSETLISDCKGKLKKSDYEAQFKDVVVLFSECQLPIMLARMLTRDVVENDNSGIRNLETQGESDSYVLSLDNTGWPTQILYHPKSGKDPKRIRYANYLKKEGLSYPGQIEIADASNGKQLAVFTISAVPVQPTPPGKK